MVLSLLLAACNGGSQRSGASRSVVAEQVTLEHMQVAEAQAIFELSNRSSVPIAFEGNRLRLTLADGSVVVSQVFSVPSAEGQPNANRGRAESRAERWLLGREESG
jgi:hypothetical protein